MATGGENRAVIGFKCIGLDLFADIIGTDQNGQHIRPQCNRICLPTCLQLRDRVTTDATVVKVQLRLGHFHAKATGQHKHEAVAEIVIAVFFITSPVHIGDRVADEQQTGSHLEGRDLFVVGADIKFGRLIFRGGSGQRFDPSGAPHFFAHGGQSGEY